MIKTFFFVPLTSEKFIQKAKTLNVDNIVYDLEDAVSDSVRNIALSNIQFVENKSKSFIRPKIQWNNINFSEIEYLYKQGFRNFIIPKAESHKDIRLLVDFFSQNFEHFQFVILVENPQILFDLPAILTDFSNVIKAVSLGSHDYCSVLGAKYEYESYQFAHDYILNVCKSYKIEAIDIASMNIQDKSMFKDEVKRSFNKGYRSKFILHPLQLHYLKEIDYFDSEEIEFAKHVVSKVNINADFDAIKIDGKILEKPHIDRIKSVIKYIQIKTELL